MASGAWAVVPAGGSGQRYSAQEDKLLARLAGIPVLVRSVKALLSADCIEGAVVAAHPEKLAAYRAVIEAAVPEKPVYFVPSGETRRASVCQGLSAVPESADVVAVHDAARPLIRPATVDAAIRQVRETPGLSVLVAIPVHDTLKDVDPETGRVRGTVDRNRLWRAQTPQVFRRDVLLQAHDAISVQTAVTDDVQLVEMAGLGEVCIVEGEARNLKITTPADMLIAEALLGLNHV